jgi:predicted metal-dependent HD superfamily phosphohydrolase
MSGHHSDLRHRFTQTLAVTGALSHGDAAFDDLVRRYGEAHRHYHTLEHVAACLGWLDRYACLAARPEEVALAIWFHDAVYDPRAHDNERHSAELACTVLRELGVALDPIERVVAHILATRKHDAEQPDSRLMVDIDLAILASPAAVFDDFERRIRREYAHVPTPSFALGRRCVLNRFLARAAIYRVPAVRQHLEAPARANLKRRIAEL